VLEAGLSAAATIAQLPDDNAVQDIVTDAAPASSDPAPTTLLLLLVPLTLL